MSVKKIEEGQSGNGKSALQRQEVVDAKERAVRKRREGQENWILKIKNSYS